MKKKILFMLINMNVGGTEKSLLTMLNEIDKANYDVTLLMLEEFGEFLYEVPEWVNIKYLEIYKDIKYILNNPLHITALEKLKNGKILTSIKLMSLYLISKIKKERSCLFKYVLNNYQILDEEYDIAVAYAGPMDFITYFVSEKINSKKKVQWIHFDVSKISFNKIFANKFYKKFDKVFVVSKEGKDKLTTFIPSLSNKIDVFTNILPYKSIQNMANRGIGFEDNFSGIRILTVGRLSLEKGQDMTIPVLSRLKSEGYDVRWYCIGDGNARKQYEQMVKQYGLENDYIFLGTNSNPYPFMKECDIYVQPSRYEGYCITLSEAMCFNNPILVTNFVGAKEQIISKEIGLISDINENQIYENLKVLIEDLIKNGKKLNVRTHTIKQTKEINKLYNIIK